MFPVCSVKNKPLYRLKFLETSPVPDSELAFQVNCTLSLTPRNLLQVLEGEREYSMHNGILIPDEILINKKLNNPAIFQKWEEFFFESG